MRCKIFNIRLEKENIMADEDKLNDFLANINVIDRFATLTQGNKIFWSILIFYADKDKQAERKGSTIITRPLTPQEEEIVADLKKWRARKSLEEGLAPFMIAHNKMLEQMILLPVRNLEDLENIKGFGEKRTEKYGAEILQIITSDLGRALRTNNGA